MKKRLWNKVISNRPLFLFILVAICLYFVFYTHFFSSTELQAGSDIGAYFLPSAHFLWESLHSGRFPIFTEKLFSGFPIYADPERNYLNPISVFILYIFGPIWWLKLLPFIAYLAGSVGVYAFLKNYSFSYIAKLCSLVIYFYNFFPLYHGQHLNMLIIYYLIPLGLYLTHRLTTNLSYKNAFWLGIFCSVLFWFGSYQTFFIALGLFAVYFFEFSKMSFIQLVKAALFSGLIFFALTVHIVLPAYSLYKDSARLDTTFVWKEGSFYRPMLVNLFYPYPAGRSADYVYLQVNEDFFIHETYVYLSVVGVILALLGYAKAERRLKFFALFVFVVFILPAFLNDLPAIVSNVPFVSMFRYWGRAVILASFLTAFFSGYAVDRLALKLPKKTLGLVIGALSLFAVSSQYFLPLLKIYYYKVLQHREAFLIWAALCLLCICFVIISERTPKRFFKSALFLLILIDLLIFSRPISFNYLKPIESMLLVPKSVQSMVGKRVFSSELTLNWNQSLYGDYGSILGYSPLIPSEYQRFLSENGVYSAKKYNDISVQGCENLGIYNCAGVVLGHESAYKFSGQINKLNVGEGIYSIDLESDRIQDLKTKIRYYQEWELYINGSKKELTRSSTYPDNLYIQTEIPEGNVNVSLVYKPKPLYFALKTASVMILVVAPLLYFAHKKFGFLRL